MTDAASHQFLNLTEVDGYSIDPDTVTAEWSGKPRCLSAALAYAAAGWQIFPAVRGAEKKSHKSKLLSNGLNWGMTRDPQEIRRDFSRWPDANIGIPTGAENGIVVVDVDTLKGHGVDGIAELRALEELYGPLPETLTSESPSGSLHFYFKHPGSVRIVSNTLTPGVDIKGDGGMVIAPPSARPGVGSYVWVRNLPLTDMPAWLVAHTAEPDFETSSDAPLTGDANEIAAMVEVIPNADLDWDDWNRIVMAIYAATGGSAKGLELSHQFSEKSAKYNKRRTDAKWKQLKTSPPERIGIGTLRYLANAADPDWSQRYEAKILAGLDAASMDDEEILKSLRDSTTEPPDEDASQPDERVDASQTSEQADAKQSSEKAEEQSDAKQSKQGDTGPPHVDPEPTTQPVDLWNKFSPPPLPLGLLPKAIEEFAIEKGRLMGADPAGFAMAALTVCAAAIPDTIKLKVKVHDNWTEETRLWTALVGDPSSKKSPTIREAKRPLEKIDYGMWRAYSTAKAQWDALPKEQKRTTPPPKQTRVMMEDSTIEAMQEVMQDSPNGILFVRDELSGWFGSMDKYAGHRGALMDRGFWLQCWNGGSYTYNRISRGAGAIENLSASVLGGIQPEPMREISDGTIDDGLIQRLIPIMVAPATMGMDAPTSDAEVRYGKLIERLHKARDPFANSAFVFSAAARTIREELERKHLDWMLCTAFNKKLRAHLGKYDGIFVRLCLVWQCIECEDEEEVSDKTAQRVADFLHNFLLPHALAFYTSIFGLSDDNDRLMEVAGYILAHKLKVVTNRTIQRGGHSMRNLKARDVEDVFNQLDAFGWVNKIPALNRVNAVQWSVNPEVHRLFADRARQEAERRRRDREMIIALSSQGRTSS